MTTLTPRLQIPIPGPADPFKPASIDLPAIGARIDAIAAREYGVVASQLAVLEIGQAGQIKAGRSLVAADFTTLLGLTMPIGIYPLNTVNDFSSNGRNLTNKGAVASAVGINGAATTCFAFAGSTAQALYFADTGGADPFRIKVGTFGAWVRTAKRGTAQTALSKIDGPGQLGYGISCNSSNVATAGVNITGPTGVAQSHGISGVTDIVNDSWHFVVASYDGVQLALYVDGELEAQSFGASGPMTGAAKGFNIGGSSADGATATVLPWFGRIDEAFVTADILSEDQVRMLYAAKFAHTYPVTPSRADLLITRPLRGAPLVVGDFPATPLHLYNFTAGALADAGSLGSALTANPGTGIITSVAGADGVANGGQLLSGNHTGLSATDAGLPAGTTARTFGAWFKTSTLGATSQDLLSWGTTGTALQYATARLTVSGTFGTGDTTNTVDSTEIFTDGQWHFGAVALDNAAADGLKTKCYVDGRLVASSTIFVGASLTLAGANAFRVGARGAASPMAGQIDGAFVYAGALTREQLLALYQKSSQPLPISQKNLGDHLEGIDATNLYLIFDTLEQQHLVDLRVAA